MVPRLAFLVAFALLGIAGAGFARAAVTDLDAFAASPLAASAAPGLLGPIDAAGRNAWQCAPERAAAAKRAREAGLPEPDGP